MKTSTTNRTPEEAALVAAIEQAAANRKRPDASDYLSLSFLDEQAIAAATGTSHRQVQLAALRCGIIPERYSRNQKTLSNEDQIRLLLSHVAVIGLGGLGGTVTEILSRIGIGTLTLVDGDSFEDSNLNRQLLSSTAALGKKKAEVAAARVADVNPAVEVRTRTEFFGKQNGDALLAGVDLVVDCLDTITDRFQLEESCRATGIPMVSAAIAGTSGQVTVVFPDEPGLKRIYGDRTAAPSKGVEKTLGTLPHAAISMAALECAEIVALAIGRPARLRDRLLLVDYADYSMQEMQF